jgi:hypothetical protein
VPAIDRLAEAKSILPLVLASVLARFQTILWNRNGGESVENKLHKVSSAILGLHLGLHLTP